MLVVWYELYDVVTNIVCLLSSAKMGYFYRAIVQLGQADVTLLFSQSPGQSIIHCGLLLLLAVSFRRDSCVN